MIADELMLPLLHSLQLGLTHYGTEMAKISLEAISAISCFIYEQKMVRLFDKDCQKKSLFFQEFSRKMFQILDEKSPKFSVF